MPNRVKGTFWAKETQKFSISDNANMLGIFEQIFTELRKRLKFQKC